jgi:hypothetical protein
MMGKMCGLPLLDQMAAVIIAIPSKAVCNIARMN